MATHHMTYEAVRELLHYSPDSGRFTWKPRDRRWFKSEANFKAFKKLYANQEAGSLRTIDGGYQLRVIVLLDKHYAAHRLAWLYMTGSWPESDIDHINRDARDNSWKNLRLAQGMNSRNLSRHGRNKSGVSGVSWSKRAGKWYAQFNTSKNGKRKAHSVGYFTSLKDAEAAILAARKKHGFDPNHGKSFAHYSKHDNRR